jgi:hypothetical protein
VVPLVPTRPERLPATIAVIVVTRLNRSASPRTTARQTTVAA